MKYYAGIGSRKTPSDILEAMRDVAHHLAAEGWTLRSGGARGADTAFEQGAQRKEIFRPSGHIPQAAIDTVAEYHPAPHRLSSYVIRLHARNAQIILGENLDSPVAFVLCWTPQGSGSGGTGQGLRIARAHDIPVFDLGDPSGRSIKGLINFL